MTNDEMTKEEINAWTGGPWDCVCGETDIDGSFGCPNCNLTAIGSDMERRKKNREIQMKELDKKKARDLAVIASAANELRKGLDASVDDIFELMIEGIKKFPDQLQAMVDTVVTMQKEFPFPEGGWEMFLRDLEHTNKKHGLSLHVKPELLEK